MVGIGPLGLVCHVIFTCIYMRMYEKDAFYECVDVDTDTNTNIGTDTDTGLHTDIDTDTDIDIKNVNIDIECCALWGLGS